MKTKIMAVISTLILSVSVCLFEVEAASNRVSQEDVARAKAVLEMMESYFDSLNLQRNVAMNFSRNVLDQPDDLPDILREYGCIARVVDGKIEFAITTKAYDYFTRKVVEPREYTKGEISRISDAVLKYKKQLGLDSNIVIIFSESSKAAACEWLINQEREDTRREYWMKRVGTLMTIQMKIGGKTFMLAAEGIYY